MEVSTSRKTRIRGPITSSGLEISPRVDICQNILAATIPKKVPLSKGKSPMKTVINPRHIAVIIQREISLTGNFHLILSQFRALCHKIQGRTNARIRLQGILTLTTGGNNTNNKPPTIK
jgi:hypothetical protein